MVECKLIITNKKKCRPCLIYAYVYIHKFKTYVLNKAWKQN